jgi:hypothetical protein
MDIMPPMVATIAGDAEVDRRCGTISNLGDKNNMVLPRYIFKILIEFFLQYL